MSTIILILILCFLFLQTRVEASRGILLYFCIRMFIPPSARIFSFSFNTISLLIIILCLLLSLRNDYNICSLKEKSFVRYTLNFSLALFVLTLCTFIVPKTYQWGALIQMLGTEIFPSCLMLIYLRKKNDYRLFCRIVAQMSIFYALYSIYTYMTSSNPIYDFFNTSGEEGMDLIDYANGRMGLSGIAVGIYDDKIACSLVGLVLFMFLISCDKINATLRYGAAILCVVAVFLTTQRTGLMCAILFVAIMFLDKRNSNALRRYGIIGIIIGVIFLNFFSNQTIDNAIYSVLYLFDDNMQQKLGVGGSSMELRAFQYINGISYLGYTSLLQGAGFGFPQYYYHYIWNSELYGMDYRFAGFESFTLKILMNSGILGIVCWGIYLYKIYRKVLGKSIYNLAFILVYIFAIIMTDASASLYLFFMLLVLNFKNESLA